MVDELLLDVSDLPPPEPLIRILNALEREGFSSMRIIHRQEPCLLYPKLEERALGYEVLKKEPGHFEMRIFQRGG